MSLTMHRPPTIGETIWTSETAKFAKVVEIIRETSRGWHVKLLRYGHKLQWHGEVQRQPRSGRLYLDHRIHISGEIVEVASEPIAAQSPEQPDDVQQRATDIVPRPRARHGDRRREKRPGRHASLDGFALAHRGSKVVARILRSDPTRAVDPALSRRLLWVPSLTPATAEVLTIAPAPAVKLPGRRWTYAKGGYRHAVFPDRRPHTEDEAVMTYCSIVEPGSYEALRSAELRCTDCPDCIRAIQGGERRPGRTLDTVWVA